jgi:prevent-host-death family protein
MTQVGVRELRQNASKVLRRVAAGEVVEVTQRGRPVARIVPITSQGVFAQMLAEGRASAASGDLLRIKAIPPVSGKPLLSEVLMELRADER